jgi:hypothetical protein
MCRYQRKALGLEAAAGTEGRAAKVEESAALKE